MTLRITGPSNERVWTLWIRNWVLKKLSFVVHKVFVFFAQIGCTTNGFTKSIFLVSFGGRYLFHQPKQCTSFRWNPSKVSRHLNCLIPQKMGSMAPSTPVCLSFFIWWATWSSMAPFWNREKLHPRKLSWNCKIGGKWKMPFWLSIGWFFKCQRLIFQGCTYK